MKSVSLQLLSKGNTIVWYLNFLLCSFWLVPSLCSTQKLGNDKMHIDDLTLPLLTFISHFRVFFKPRQEMVMAQYLIPNFQNGKGSGLIFNHERSYARGSRNCFFPERF